jgi:two-component system, OmpR family, response regulator MprA
MDPATREVSRHGRSIALTRTEYAILELLLRNAGRVVTRDALINGIWGGSSDIESNTLDAFVRLLRSKVESAGQPRLVRTIRGIGYSANPEAG